MPIRTYNNFTQGVKQDDYITQGPGFVEHKNIDGLRDGYGVTLGNKVNKGIITTESMSAIAFGTIEAPIRLDISIVGGRDGKIYELNSDTLLYTLPSGGDIRNIIKYGTYYLIFWQGSGNGKIARVATADVSNGTFASLVESYADAPTTYKSVPTVTIGTNVYFGVSGAVAIFDGTATVTSKSFPDDWVVGLTLQGTTIVVYARSGNVYLWDGDAAIYSALKYLGSRIIRAKNSGDFDYIYTFDGQMYVGRGLGFTRVTKPKKSNRMNDNASYDERLKFDVPEENYQNNISLSALGDTYIACNDTIPGIYKRGALFPGMKDGLHKVVTQNHLGTQIDFIYDMFFHGRDDNWLFFSYKAGTTYGVDYIDLSSLETTTDGYMITEIFAAQSSFEKSINKLLRATSNTNGSNYIKLYYRKNNGAWILVRNISDSTAEITRDELNTDSTDSDFLKNIDIQFKIEFHNDTGAEASPTLHELVYDYVIE